MIDRVRLERFVDEYADKAYAFAVGLCADEQAAQDLVQEAFVRLFDHAASLDEEKGLDQWFLTVMKRLYLDGIKRMDNRPKVDFDCPIGGGLTVAEAIPDERDAALAARLERAETKGLVRRAMGKLVPEHKAILLMVDMNGMGYEESAQALGVPLGTVRSRIVRARDALRAVLMDMEVTP